MFTMRWVLLLTAGLFTFTTAGADEPLPADAQEAVRRYEAEMTELHEEIELKRLQARAKLDKALLKQQTTAADKGQLDVARRIESERTQIQSANRRAALAADLEGREFRWQASEETWRFLGNGTIADGTTRYPWFALDEREVLVRHRDGSFRLLKFDADRSNCHVHYLPAGQPGKGIALIEVE